MRSILASADVAGRVAISSAAARWRTGSTRRVWLGLACFGMAVAVGLASAGEATDRVSPAGYAVSLARIDRSLSQRFPLRLAAGGLFQIMLEQPLLRPLPAQNRMAATLRVTLAGPALASAEQGQFELDFGLRYERGDRTLRAHDLSVRSLRVAGLPPPYPELLEGVSQALADRSLGEVVLHRLGPRDLALADVMGLEPDSVTVTAAGLVIGFAARPAR